MRSLSMHGETKFCTVIKLKGLQRPLKGPKLFDTNADARSVCGS